MAFQEQRLFDRKRGESLNVECALGVAQAVTGRKAGDVAEGGSGEVGAPAIEEEVADEVAVELFLERKIVFSDIPNLIASTLEAHKTKIADSLESVTEADSWARQRACGWLS